MNRILGPGEFYYKENFGPGTVCRGAVLLECEWDGGVVESGALMGVVFRSGERRSDGEHRDSVDDGIQPLRTITRVERDAEKKQNS